MGGPRNSLSTISDPPDHRCDPVDRFFRKSWFEVDPCALRESLGLSQKEFARRFGFPLATLRHWERRNRRPSGPALALLHVIAYNPSVATRALIRARRRFGDRPLPEPEIRPSRTPFERVNPTAPDDDIDR